MKCGNFTKLASNYICDISISLEERINTKLVLFSYTNNDSICFSQYTPNELAYHIKQCEYANLIFIGSRMNGGYLIKDLTPQAHEFWMNIRLDTNWAKTTAAAKKAVSTALSVLIQVVSNVITNQLNNLHIIN